MQTSEGEVTGSGEVSKGGGGKASTDLRLESFIQFCHEGRGHRLERFHLRQDEVGVRVPLVHERHQQ